MEKLSFNSNSSSSSKLENNLNITKNYKQDELNSISSIGQNLNSHLFSKRKVSNFKIDQSEQRRLNNSNRNKNKKMSINRINFTNGLDNSNKIYLNENYLNQMENLEKVLWSYKQIDNTENRAKISKRNLNKEFQKLPDEFILKILL